jgi:hypothetical protein
MKQDDLRKTRPNVTSAAGRFVRGEITRAEFERQAAKERRDDVRPPDEQTAKAR